MWQRGPGTVPCLIHRDLSLSQWAPSRFSRCATWPRPCPFPLAAGGSWGVFVWTRDLGGSPSTPNLPPAAVPTPQNPGAGPGGGGPITCPLSWQRARMLRSQPWPVPSCSGELPSPGAVPSAPGSFPLLFPAGQRGKALLLPGCGGCALLTPTPRTGRGSLVAFGSLLSCPGTRARRLRRAGQVSAIPVAGIYFLSPCPTFRAVPCPFSGLALLLCFCRDRNSPRGAKIELRICKCCLCSPCCLLLFSRNDDFPANLSPARRFGIRERWDTELCRGARMDL